MRTTLTKLAAAALCAAVSAGCGDVARQGRAPVQVVIESLQGAPGSRPGEYGNPLLSDVETFVTQPPPCSTTTPCRTRFNDLGQVTMTLILKDPGSPGAPAAPTDLNQVTFTRYRVQYRRSDGRNTPGVDVPHPIDAALTFTVPANGNATAGFELVRNIAKQEAPLVALITDFSIISTIADVSFYGRDQAGNEVIASGSITVNFGNFADRQ